jgi:uronate dehydrogenase
LPVRGTLKRRSMAGPVVLVTGLSGLIGGALRAHLASTHELRALNRRLLPGVPGHQADIADLAAIQPVFTGVDVVVHLAAKRRPLNPPFDDLLKTNLIGPLQRLRGGAARGSGYERDLPYRALAEARYDEAPTWRQLTHETPVRPAGLYGCSKVWGEALGRHYADTHGLSVICLRIGHVTAEDRPVARRGTSRSGAASGMSPG